MRHTFVTGLAVFILLMPGCVILSAQGTSSLDTAPGVPTTPGTNVPAPVSPSQVPVTPPVPPRTPLVSNGDFATVSKDANWPDDWGKGGERGVTWNNSNGQRFIRLTSQQPDQFVQLYRVVDIPAGITGVEFFARYRVAGLKNGRFAEDTARTILEFLDKGGKPIAAAPPVDFSGEAVDWTNVNERFVVPVGAVKLAVMSCLFRVEKGTLDLAEIQITTLDQPESAKLAAESAAAAVQKLAAQTAILASEMALPARTPELKASSNKLVTEDGKDVWLQGVNVCNLATASGGEHTVLWSIHVAIDEWHANVIRLPVMDSFWFGKGRGKQASNDPEAYRAIVDKAVQLAAAKGAYIVLDLHRFLTPDESCVVFWKDAAARYKNNPAVLFDIFNEPHDTSWEVWQKGGPVQIKQKDGTMQTVQGVGMQALVDAVRGTGARNMVVAGGLGYAFDLTGVVNGYALDDKGGNGIMYATHFYNWAKGWSAHFMAVADKYPVFVGETGADINKMNFIPAKAQEDPYTWAPDAIGFIQKNRLNWTAWCLHTRATPDLLLDWDYYTPTPFWGAFVKDALAGKQYEMKKER